MDSIIAGGDLLGYKAEKKKQPTGCSQAMFIEANVEDRETLDSDSKYFKVQKHVNLHGPTRKLFEFYRNRLFGDQVAHMKYRKERSKGGPNIFDIHQTKRR